MKLDESISTTQITVSVPFGHIRSIPHLESAMKLSPWGIRVSSGFIFLPYLCRLSSIQSFSRKVRMQLVNFSLVKYDYGVLFIYF